MLTLTPINLKTANAFVQQYHRHHKPTRGHKFSIGVSKNGELVGVAICGRPVARRLDDGYTLEVNPPVYGWNAERLQYFVCGGISCGTGNGLQQSDHLHSGYGKWSIPESCRIHL